MVKIREPLSICDATRKAHAALGDAGVRAVTAKSAALVLKWSDPDDDAHHIPFHQAIALDVAMVRAKLLPPHLEVLKAAIEDALPPFELAPEKPRTLSQRVADLAKEFGDFAGAVVEAEQDRHVTKAERKRLHDELQDIIDRARQAQKAVKG
jgi:hypothetical protein